MIMEKDFIKQAINDFCSEKSLSKFAFSKMCGVSDATLSFIENEQWEKVSDEMIRKIRVFIDHQKNCSLFQSTDFLSIFKACDFAQKHHMMVGILADTGLGKTTTVRAYALKKNVYYISAYKSMKATQFFEELLQVLAIPFKGSLYEMIKRAVEELNKKENPLLIIDEAGIINRDMMLYLRELRDKTSVNCGIVLAGMPYFKDKLVKYANGNKEGCAEFLRRVNLWHTCPGLNAKEVKEICRIHGVNDPNKIKELKREKAFGNLMNKIYLYKMINGGF